MDSNYTSFPDIVQREFIGAKYDCIDDAREILTKLYGSDVFFIDRRIADGADDDNPENTYIMVDTFETDDNEYIFRICYGNVDREIGYVEVEKINLNKGKKLNTEFNEVYDAISSAYEKMNEFYMKHCALGQNDIDSGFVMCDLREIWDSLGKCKEMGHEVAEHFTWDN